MIYTFYTNSGNCCSGQRRKQNATQRIAKRSAISPLKRPNHKFAVGTIFVQFHTLNDWLLYFNHLSPPCAAKYIWSNSENPLLKIQLNNEGLLDLNIYVFTCRQLYKNSCQCLCVEGKPRRNRTHIRKISEFGGLA